MTVVTLSNFSQQKVIFALVATNNVEKQIEAILTNKIKRKSLNTY